MFWMAVIGAATVLVFLARHLVRKHAERERAEEARAAAFLAQMSGAARPIAAQVTASSPARETLQAAPIAALPAASSAIELQKLLFEAARKAGEAGEPVLALQLYGRLLARFPDSGFAAEVRAAAEAQKKKIVKA